MKKSLANCESGSQRIHENKVRKTRNEKEL